MVICSVVFGGIEVGEEIKCFMVKFLRNSMGGEFGGLVGYCVGE